MTLRTYRPSEIKTFKRCRRQWALKYLHGLQPEEESGSASTGTLVHRALEAWYKSEPFEMPATEEAELALIMIEGYLDWLEQTGIDAGLTVEGVEMQLEVELPATILGDRIVIQGHIDLLATDSLGLRKLIDHKTVQSLEQYSRQLQVDDQMLTYAVMLKLEGIEISGAIHNAIKRVKRTARAKPPFYQRNEVSYNVDQLRNHYKHLQGVIGDMVLVEQQIENGIDPQYALYPTPNKDCTWDCGFLGICAMHDDGSDIEGILQMMKGRVA